MGRARRLCVMGAAMLVGANAPAIAQHMNAKASPCQKAVSTVDMVTCLDKARARADGDLNRSYNRILKALGAADRRRLVDAERSWVVYRDKMCAAERGLYDGGTGGGPTYLACLEALTRAHAENLRAGFGWRLEK